MQTPHTFLIPDPATFVSGGNLYNAELMQALKELGVPCCRCSLEEFDVQKPNGITWIDTLWMQEWQQDYQGPTGLIVHHLESLFSESESELREEEKVLLDKFDVFLCTSEFTADYLQSLGVAESNCLVVEPGMHLSVPEKREYPVDPPRALIVGNLVPRKGILPFLSELLALEEYWSDFTVSIAGNASLDPEYARTCQDLVEHSPALAARVTFVGELSREEMTEAYLSHSIFLSPSMMETFGMAIREALCMGLPAFVMTSGGFSRQHFKGGKQSGAFASTHQQLAKFLIQTAKPTRHRDFLFSQQWQHKPTPSSWKNQATSFITQTEKWLTNK